VPFRRDCSQAAEQHLTHVDNSGISAQATTGDGTALDDPPTPTDQKGAQLQGGAAAPGPAAYGLLPPLFQPLTAYAARGRIFPARVRGPPQVAQLVPLSGVVSTGHHEVVHTKKIAADYPVSLPDAAD
jgi:hypothetical protein